MNDKERYKIQCDIKKRCHLLEGDVREILKRLKLIEDDADELVVNGNKKKIKGGGDEH